MLVYLSTPSARAHGSVSMRQGGTGAHRKEDTVIEILAQPLIEAHGLIVEAHALRRQVVGTDDCSIARGVASGEVTLVKHGNIRNAPILDQVVGRGETMTAGAHDDYVVGGFQILGLGEVALCGVLRAQSIF